MDSRLQELMHELGQAINASLSGSDRIGEAIGAIKAAGYDVFLVLECTIAFSKRDDSHEPEPQTPTPPAAAHKRRTKFTLADHELMRAMKISLDYEPKNPPKK